MVSLPKKNVNFHRPVAPAPEEPAEKLVKPGRLRYNKAGG
jgi:hypothetical protein